MPRAGLTRAAVVEAGADMVDEVGFDHLSMGLLAQRLGVKTPSLYKHVTSQADLAHEIASLATTGLAGGIEDGIRGLTGTDALAAGAVAMRDFVRKHPGRYTAANTATLGGQDDPLRAASARVMAAWATMLEGYHLDHGEQIHAQRMLRSMLHGFATIEASGGFQIDAPVEDSFTWITDFMDHALRCSTSSS